MTLIITKSINPDDQQELFAGLRQYNQQYLDAAQFGDLGVYSRDAQGVIEPGQALASINFNEPTPLLPDYAPLLDGRPRLSAAA